MLKTIIGLYFFVAFSRGQDTDLEVYFLPNNATRIVDSGSKNLNFTCGTNQNVYWFLSNKFYFLHRRARSDEEIILTSLGVLQGPASPDHYTAEAIMGGEHPVFTLEIKEVRDIDDGYVICELREAEPGSGYVSRDITEVIVLRKLEKLELMLDNQGNVTQDTEQPIVFSVDVGARQVSCAAEGSNPAPEEVYLELNGERLHLDTQVDLMPGDLRRYRTVVSGQVQVKSDNSGQTLTCIAVTHGGNMTRAELRLDVLVYEPNVVCNTSDIKHKGKDIIVIACTVDHDGMKVKRLGMEVGDQTVFAGNSNYTNGGQSHTEVKTKPLSKMVTQMELYLNETNLENTGDYLRILIEHESGHVSMHPVQLPQSEKPSASVDSSNDGDSDNGSGSKSGPGDGAGKLVSSISPLLLVLVCSFLGYKYM